ncbi:hypothetical protein Q73A0000_05575 [Kaistella flava (ex Peng et al. 2021)]|uniref:Uncharacterized protein n=1 Tax=Kaistella flava (ex Peng et al. 2021) TaxID=2038776 RepID=A0A7M2Y7R9_9FLAO|nr:hypothetical protein [Kaistella flava (ex Peng et al. 2021)]QOW09869.1 hypothetical protein Q73A0000_05575 [Kaistella flava (ex Peng et al. 2021)]
MNRTLKIILIIILSIAIIIGIVFFIANGKMKKSNLAKQNADNIIENLDNQNILKEFPDKNFPDKAQIQNLISGISQNCDWKKKDGKFVDFFTMKNIGGVDQTAYIYEYYLKCDSLRFILTYNMDKEKPELSRFDIQPLEEPNEMIIYPEKQLKNRK